MKVYAFPVVDYYTYDGKLLVTGALYSEEGKFLVSVNGIGLKGFQEKVEEICKVRSYEPEYSHQAPQWLIRKIMEAKNEQQSN